MVCCDPTSIEKKYAIPLAPALVSSRPCPPPLISSACCILTACTPHAGSEWAFLMIFTGVLNTVCAIAAVIAFPDPPAGDYTGDGAGVLQLLTDADDSLTLALILQIVALLFQVGLCASVTGRLSRGLVGLVLGVLGVLLALGAMAIMWSNTSQLVQVGDEVIDTTTSVRASCESANRPRLIKLGTLAGY